MKALILQKWAPVTDASMHMQHFTFVTVGGEAGFNYFIYSLVVMSVVPNQSSPTKGPQDKSQ